MLNGLLPCAMLCVENLIGIILIDILVLKAL